jgi:hypothetical protein
MSVIWVGFFFVPCAIGIICEILYDFNKFHALGSDEYLLDVIYAENSIVWS